MSSNNGHVIKKDFLVKRAQLKSFFTKENYKCRWFELTDSVLRYSDGTQENGIGRLKGQILLRNIKNVEEADQEPLGFRPFAFQVVYKDEDERNVLYIITHNEAQRKEWISAITQACLQSGANLSLRYHPGVWLKSGKFSCCYSINKRSEGCQRGGQNISCDYSPGKVLRGSLDNLLTATRPLPPIPKNTYRNSTKSPLNKRSHSTQLYSMEEPKYSKVLALFDYHSMQKDDLDLVKGEEYDVIDMVEEQSSWWVLRNKFGVTGYAPANYVQPVTGDCLNQYDWFYPNLSRNQSEDLLNGDGREGVFLVRDSSQEGLYTLSIYTKAASLGVSQVKHYLIKRDAHGLYYVAEDHLFNSIPELVYYHRHNCAGLIVRLRIPAGDKSLYKPACGLGHDLKEIDIESIEIKEELGRGQFGKVSRGIYLGKIEVAVKTMTDGSLEEDFIAEAFTMTNLQHDNLVKLYGVCTKTSPIRIVTEYLKNGALLNYLKKHRQRLLCNVDKLVDMCIEVSKGMSYLEQKQIIHRDLAARNCLVDEKGGVKVGDFGLARYVLDNEYMSSAGSKFPVRWSSPEVLNFNKFSSKSDVWAYGVLVWEIFTCGETPYVKIKNLVVVSEVCMGTLTLQQPPNCPNVMYNVMKMCWRMEPEQRPSFGELSNKLLELLKDREYDD